MEYEKNICPVLNVDGILATGKQFDLEITLPEDNRSVIYGVVKDCYQDPVCNAVVKLVEVVCDCGKEERRPVSHTFTDEDGQFVFGPLCANKFYEIEIWVDFVRHCKICKKVERETKCLKGVKLDCKDHDKDHDCKMEKHLEKECDEKWEKDCKKEHDDKCDKHCEKECDDKWEKDCKKEHDDKCDKHCEKECDDKWEKDCKKEHDDKCDKHCEKPCDRPCRPFGRMY